MAKHCQPHIYIHNYVNESLKYIPVHLILCKTHKLLYNLLHLWTTRKGALVTRGTTQQWIATYMAFHKRRRPNKATFDHNYPLIKYGEIACTQSTDINVWSKSPDTFVIYTAFYGIY